MYNRSRSQNNVLSNSPSFTITEGRRHGTLPFIARNGKILIPRLPYTAKNEQLVVMLMKTALNNVVLPHIVQYCRQYCPAMLQLIQFQQYYSIFLTAMGNMGSKTLFNLSLALLETPRKFIIAKLSIRKLVSSSVLISKDLQ